MRAIVCQQSSEGKKFFTSAFSAFNTYAKYKFILVYKFIMYIVLKIGINKNVYQELNGRCKLAIDGWIVTIDKL
jgi:hypothetical protein